MIAASVGVKVPIPASPEQVREMFVAELLADPDEAEQPAARKGRDPELYAALGIGEAAS